MKFEMVGKRFGRLLVLSEGEKAKSGECRWICKCDCGVITPPIKSTRLRKGITKSCGCLQKEIVTLRVTKHNKSHSRLYSIWRGIKERCLKQNSVNYKYYGGRGITICDEWKNDFQAFYDWAMSHGYADCLTIDRIDNDSNYEPSNCRWATNKEQQNNRRNNKKVKPCESST